MLRMTIALQALLVHAAMAFSEIPDSSGREMGLDSLVRKVDSLEASLTRLRFELQDRSPYVNGAALKWGRWLGAGANAMGNSQVIHGHGVRMRMDASLGMGAGAIARSPQEGRRKACEGWTGPGFRPSGRADPGSNGGVPGSSDLATFWGNQGDEHGQVQRSQPSEREQEKAGEDPHGKKEREKREEGGTQVSVPYLRG